MELEETDKETLGEGPEIELPGKGETIKITGTVAKALLKADGTLPSKSPELHKQITQAIIDDWQLNKASEIMMANRMVGLWMKLLHAEKLLAKYDLVFEELDDSGKIVGLSVNQLAPYIQTLESGLRSYFKALDGRKGRALPQSVDFMDFINEQEPKRKRKK